jgi:hypothetical protein
MTHLHPVVIILLGVAVGLSIALLAGRRPR